MGSWTRKNCKFPPPPKRGTSRQDMKHDLHFLALPLNTFPYSNEEKPRLFPMNSPALDISILETFVSGQIHLKNESYLLNSTFGITFTLNLLPIRIHSR